MSDAETSVVIDEFVATVEICRPPNNFFDQSLIEELAFVLETLDERKECRSVVLCSRGKHFCAGANFSDSSTDPVLKTERMQGLYDAAVRMFRTKKPIVAAVQGAAIGGGLGLALTADFRVGCCESRFSANFSQLGLHPGFGISVTLPRVVGRSNADRMLFVGNRVGGDDALAIGLIDDLVPCDELRRAAWQLARKIASSAPLAVQAIRKISRQELADAVEAAVEYELREQIWLRDTDDFAEGVKAMSERRTPRFLEQ